MILNLLYIHGLSLRQFFNIYFIEQVTGNTAEERIQKHCPAATTLNINVKCTTGPSSEHVT